MKDIEIEKLLNEINNSGLFSFKENEPEKHVDIVKYRRNLQYFQKELKVIRQSFSNKDFFELTAFGNLIMRKGGWIKYQKEILLKEKIEFEKAKTDLTLAKKMLEEFPKTKLFSRIGAFIGIGLAILELIKWIMQLIESSGKK
tara:strand:+ start:4257 stop:4685 length:429 start_codon:yes stop_codon:yes gene_type:complete